LLMPQAIEDASVVAAASGAKQLRAGSRPPTRGDRPGPPPAASRKPSRPGTRPSTLAVCGSSAIVAGPAPPWHRLLPSRPGGLVGSRPATAESNHTDWIMDDVSASPPPTAGGSPPMAGMGAIDGWGMTSYDLDEQAAEPNASCQAIHSSTAIYSSTGSRHGAPGGHAQVLFLDGHETEPPPAVSMLANSSAPPLTAGSPHHFAAQSTAPAAGAAATSGRRAQDGREIASSHEMPISLRGGTAGHTPTLERAPLRLRAEAAGPHATCVGCSGIFCTGGGDVVAVQVEMRTGQVRAEETSYRSFPHGVPCVRCLGLPCTGSVMTIPSSTT
jgi:prepilin-type processing-associated H-X9-DG protein